MILLGYGAYTLADRAFSSDAAPAPTGNGFVASVNRATAYATFGVGTGVNLHLTGDLQPFRDGMNNLIADVRTERANLEQRAASTPPPRADTLRAAIDSMIRLETAMAQFRDAVFQMRFATVPTAQTAVDRAVGELQQEVQTWEAQRA